tara:strand:- start:220633 stop:221874 length:1242 start_codon:yes stop_codon:yes gene_type:complete
MISVIEARDSILELISPLGVERVDIISGQGRVLAENIYATRNQPPWDNSAMDGYAVRAADTIPSPPDNYVELEIIEDLPAGYQANRAVKPGQATHIMTGAPIPKGADAIVRTERATRVEPKLVRILEPVDTGTDLRKTGEDIRDGDLMLVSGKLLRAAEVGLLASTNRAYIPVYRRPRVAILSTGDEIVDMDTPLIDGKIVDSNGYTLTALVADAGAVPIRLGICPDNQEALEQAILDGLVADIIITSGGVSVGEYDFVKGALEAVGTSMEFWKVNMTPGRPLAFGTINDAIVFGLPGNPVASMVTFELFVRPALLRMQGYTHIYRRTVKAILEEDLTKSLHRKQFIRVNLEKRGDTFFASKTGAQGSGILKSMALADGLAISHEDQEFMMAGDIIEVMLLGGYSDLSIDRNC